VISKRRLRIAGGVLAGLCVLTAGIGWMHTSAGRVLLAKLGVPCPVDTVDPKLVLRVRDNAIASSRGTALAPSRPAFGLQLDSSTDTQVSEWAARTHSQCDSISRGYHYLRCRGVLAASLGLTGPAISEIWFSFGPSRTLLAINLYRRGMDEAQARESWQTAVDNLQQHLGNPMTASGDQSLAQVVQGPVAVASVEYKYSNYIAIVTASHLPYGGLAVREQYMSAVASPAAVAKQS
jgi:hypothetical protein